MRHDGPKKFGRFLKKGSHVLNKVVLEEFAFSEITTSTSIEQDNVKRSIVHARYHHDEEIAKSIQKPGRFDDDLSHPDSRRPIIFPVDFTRDWERESRLKKDRNQRTEEDDDFSYTDPYEKQNKSTYDLAQKIAVTEEAKSGKNPPPRSNPEDDESEITRLHTPLKIAGPAITKFAKTVDDKLGNHFSMGSVTNNTQAPLNLEQALNPNNQVVTPDLPASPADDFIPSNGSETDSVSDPEQAASDTYRNRVAQDKIDQEKIQALYEEAKARGFQDGFRAGEEKGEMQVRQSAALLFQKVHGLVESFMELKSTVLNNVQENFYTISQSVAEALLKKEFKINPDAFATVVRKAIADAVAPNDFKIKVHPKMAEKLANIADKDFLRHLVKDASVDDGDFKIESNLSVVNVNISKLIADLIDQTDIALFDDVEKAG